eukprot:TRINITY_DN38860_c0_g1_i1.p1 TRINITY_DN38860_c0_g1~~TRINITY_DN38860_c0_g1_i1.p1  ORF type:complete len:458 (+),score=95.03 TRINITY_DN38860_c0_g1_i1:122-1495(+)
MGDIDDSNNLYDARAGLFSTVLRLRSTVWEHVGRSLEFWGFLCLHGAIRLLHTHGFMHGDDKESPLFLFADHIHIITAFTTFFEVFYTNQCFTRYLRLFQEARWALNGIHRFVFSLSVFLQNDASRPYARTAARYVLSAVVLFFYSMNGRISEDEWDELLKKGLLKEQEKKFLARHGALCPHLIALKWAAQVTRAGHALSGAAPNALNGMIDELFMVKDLQQSLVDTLSLPLPFPYFHLLSTMVTVNLMLWAYNMGVTNSFLASIVYVFVVAVFMGMMELAAQLSDPFGDDEVDFPVNAWLHDYMVTTAVLLETHYPDASNQWKNTVEVESKLKFARMSSSVDIFTEAHHHPGGDSRESNHHNSRILARGSHFLGFGFRAPSGSIDEEDEDFNPVDIIMDEASADHPRPSLISSKGSGREEDGSDDLLCSTPLLGSEGGSREGSKRKASKPTNPLTI